MTVGDLKLDTSGGVLMRPMSPALSLRLMRWTDLDPFTQGYIEALFAGAETGK